MNWDDIRIFLAVARSGQILGAAKRLGLNHTTVARRLTALETALSTTLIERRTNGSTLTQAGEEFLLAAERMEAEMLSARAQVGDADVAVSGTVRVGAPDGFGVNFLSPRLARLTRQYPDLTIQLVPVPRSFSLSRREADIAITVDRPDQGRLVARRLVDYTLGLYAHRSYLDTHGMPESVEELGRHRLIGYVEDLVVNRSLAYAQEISRDWKPAFEVSSSLGQVEAVRAGGGIGILHAFIARADPDLVAVLTERVIRRAYWLSYHESARTLRRVTAVSALISELVESERALFS
ncbi:MAG: LysR family transcriptional regulator [Rhizobiales bacterium]|nr:LysR family transcriptional regulator [Hyphomicrobiales bacterium]OJY03827.1 MAG: LysR family transcriptional regulator [Rhizobiales bacterium 63-22]